jgi:hypothetical protein
MNVAVFLGDSACVSIDPKKLPFAAYNLGTQRGVGPSGFLITAEAYLHGHPKPRAVVLAVILPYDQSLMWDSIHINAAGVGKFMPTVARDVQAALGRHDPFSRSGRRGKEARRECVGVALQRRESLRVKGSRR